MLILKGFSATVMIFLLGITMAFVLAVLMLGMNSHKYLRYISRPVTLFIRTIHDVPSIDINQHAAAEMLGLTGWNKYRYVILPQAVKPMLPLLGAETKVLLRATTYAGYISEVDLVKVTEIIRNQTYDVLVPLLLVSIVFLILSNLVVEGLSVIYNKAFEYDQN